MASSMTKLAPQLVTLSPPPAPKDLYRLLGVSDPPQRMCHGLLGGSVDPPQRMCTNCWGSTHPTPKSVVYFRRVPPPQKQNNRS